MLHRLAVVGLVLATACSSNSSPQASTTTGSNIDPTVSGPLASNLVAQVPALSGNAALSVQGAALALQAGVQADDVALAAGAVITREPRTVSGAISSGGGKAFGFQLTVLNAPGGPSTQTFSGVLAFEGSTDAVLVAGVSPQSNIPPGVGLLLSSGQLWQATAGQETAQLVVQLGACPVSTLPAYITACNLATFDNAGFAISASSPVAGGATGSQTASLLATKLVGAALTLDCSKTTLCGSATPVVSVGISPPAASVQTGGTQQFMATVTGTTNTAVNWTVQEGTAGGMVSTSGLYTAPATTGAYHVIATSAADTSKSASATVTVSAPQPQGSTFIVDSTGYLLSFDANGAPITKVKLPGTVGDLNGGEVALANGNVYVTLGAPTNAVVAYTQAGLNPVTLANGAFSGLNTPRGIAYDSHNQRFYIGNGGAGVNVYDMNGGTISVNTGFPNRYGPSGVAYDGDNNTVWVANYAGYAGATYGTAEYNEDGTATQTINLTTQFVSPNAHTQPYAMGYCPVGCGANNNIKVWVGFIDDGSGQGTPIVQAYDTTGAVIGGFAVSVVKPYQVSFDSVGNLWIADKGGIIWEVPFQGNNAPESMKASLTSPIYGVAAN